MKIKEDGDGIHPNEVVVAVPTTDGQELLVVHRRSIDAANSIDIGYPIAEKNDLYLVELPRETMRGLWRVWVQKSAFLKERQFA